MHIIHGRLKAAIDVYIPAAHWHEVCGAGAPIEPLHQLAHHEVHTTWTSRHTVWPTLSHNSSMVRTHSLCFGSGSSSMSISSAIFFTSIRQHRTVDLSSEQRVALSLHCPSRRHMQAPGFTHFRDVSHHCSHIATSTAWSEGQKPARSGLQSSISRCGHSAAYLWCAWARSRTHVENNDT